MSDSAARGGAAGVTLRALVPGDWPSVREIYRAGIETGDATFETAVPEWDGWNAARRAEPRIAAELDGQLAQFKALRE